MDEIFLSREDLDLEINKLSQIRNSILAGEWKDEIMEKSLGEYGGYDVSIVDMMWVWWIWCVPEKGKTYNRHADKTLI